MPEADKSRVDRRVGNTIPTWVLVAALVLIAIGFAALVIFA